MDTPSKKEDKPICKYGSKCYRKNKKHLEDFSHPDTETVQDKSEPDGASPEPPPAKRQRRVETGKKQTGIGAFFASKEKDKDGQEKDKDGGPKKKDCGDDKGEDNKKTQKAQDPDKNHGSKQEAAEGSTSDQETVKAPSVDVEEMVDSASVGDVRAEIKCRLLVEMPKDFYAFWDLAKSINPKQPNLAFRKTLGLELVGPYDILGGRCHGKHSPSDYLRHWRYYYDPPEFMTILRGNNDTLYHMGYFRDDPGEMPTFVASNAATKNCLIKPCGENVFAAVCLYIDGEVKERKAERNKLMELRKQVEAAAKAGGFGLEPRTPGMKARDKKTNCKLFHGAGMVVPVDDQDVGYREVPEAPADLKRMFGKVVSATGDKARDEAMDPLMEIIMLVQFANDECDYGEGLELGLCMFSYGGEPLHPTCLNLLTMAYNLLGRSQYGQIITAHLEQRRKGAELNYLT